MICALKSVRFLQLNFGCNKKIWRFCQSVFEFKLTLLHVSAQVRFAGFSIFLFFIHKTFLHPSFRRVNLIVVFKNSLYAERNFMIKSRMASNDFYKTRFAILRRTYYPCVQNYGTREESLSISQRTNTDFYPLYF